jgi:hypothetical protein
VTVSAPVRLHPGNPSVGKRRDREEGTVTCVDPSASVVVVVAANVDVDADADTEADVDAGPKIELGAGVVVCDRVRYGEPNEEPTLPALGRDEPSLPPSPNVAGDPNATPPKVNGDGFAGEPKELPNMLLTGGSGALLSLVFVSVVSGFCCRRAKYTA